MSDDTVLRPISCPKPGEVEAFDAGWNAHEVGLELDTVRVLASDPGWAMLGYLAREGAAPTKEDA